MGGSVIKRAVPAIPFGENFAALLCGWAMCFIVVFWPTARGPLEKQHRLSDLSVPDIVRCGREDAGQNDWDEAQEGDDTALFSPKAMGKSGNPRFGERVHVINGNPRGSRMPDQSWWHACIAGGEILWSARLGGEFRQPAQTARF